MTQLINKKRWALVGVIASILVLTAFLLWARSYQAGDQRSVEALARDLGYHGSLGYTVAQKAWPLLPDRIAFYLADLKPEPPEVIRRRAAEILGEWGEVSAPAVPALVQALSDPDIMVQQSVIGALCAISGLRKLGSRAFPAVEELELVLAKDPKHGVRFAAYYALTNIAPGKPYEPPFPSLPPVECQNSAPDR